MVVEPRVTPRSKSSSPPRFHPGTQILNRDTMIDDRVFKELVTNETRST